LFVAFPLIHAVVDDDGRLFFVTHGETPAIQRLLVFAQVVDW
jgi:hypothetical protein